MKCYEKNKAKWGSLGTRSFLMERRPLVQGMMMIFEKRSDEKKQLLEKRRPLAKRGSPVKRLTRAKGRLLS